MQYEIHTRNEAMQGTSQDFFGHWQFDTRHVFAFGDGAGGSIDGLSAAKTFVANVEECAKDLTLNSNCIRLLKQSDYNIAQGETTGILLILESGEIAGASVGDSSAKIIHHDSVTDLTAGQSRKPRLGTGDAEPRSFSGNLETGLLIISSDGLWNYVNESRLREAACGIDFPISGRLVTDLVRLNSGALHDDVGIMLIRKRLPSLPR